MRRIPISRTTLAIVIAVNLLLLVAYLWSRGGQTTHIRVEVQGDVVTTFVDGRLTLRERVAGPPLGGVVLNVAGTAGTPSLPSPSGLDRVVVRELTGAKAVLVDESFESPLAAPWTSDPGLQVRDGLLIADDAATIAIRDAQWRDYSVDATYKNVTSGEISVRVRGTEAILYQFIAFRDPEQSLILARTQGDQERIARSRIDLDRSEIARGMLAMPLRAYPYAVAGLAIAFLVVAVTAAAARHFPVGRSGVSLGGDWRSDASWVAGAIAIAAFATTLVLADRYQVRDPNWPDSVSYVFQAKIFASGRVWAPAPPVDMAFDFFFPPLTSVHGDRWTTIFPFGHPLALAPGQLFGAAWVVPPILGAASVALLFAYGRKIYASDAVGLIAALLLATSPFFLMQASNLMSHNTAVFYMLASLVLVTRSRERPWLFGVFAGVLFGLLFNTRPLTAVAMVPLFAFELLWGVWRERIPTDVVRRVAPFAAGALAMLAIFLLYNFAISGDALSGAYGQSNSGRLGFGGAHSLSRGLQNEQTGMAYLLLVLDAWPVWVGLAFVLLPFILGTRNRHDWALLCTAAIAMGAYVLFDENGVMQGPRMWYEAVPLLMLLAARGFLLAAQTVDRAARSMFSGGDGTGPATVASYVLSMSCLAGLVVFGVYAWLFGQRGNWDVTYVPANPGELRGFNRVDNRLDQLADAAGVDHGLVLVNGCLHWECYGTVFWRNSPQLDGNVVYARRPEGDDLDELLAAFPDRRVYVADYGAPYLLPYGSEGQQGSRYVMPDVQAPLASDLIALVGP